ncbi:Fe2+-dependent dioxygenase [Novosphingobium sp. Gsoil 351]|uniref:Fe2+-dependent dioxygenase n=1 Tax=Novosphingobium sp. Gsoil 351 TaxID=2675225 RepID=UPI0012B4EEEA|nr:Fe2+-dependent dioxygenase [Novosphingobium sp. Gsoil 351]QGN55248.1 Fe2+-dependent dioxygenase [Novosphingobium sp. Gsoil 351]
MMIAIPDVLNAEQLAAVRATIDGGEWIDGNATSGHQSALAKRNRQLAEGSAAAREAGTVVIAALQACPTFIAAALPAKIFPPLFNRYAAGEAFGTHVDNAIRLGPDGLRVRSDLSATLFLADPGSYDGGELTVEDRAGAQAVKLPAGHMLLYPASSLHRVEPVTRGERIACFFWVQSMVRDDGARRILFDLDNAARSVAAAQGHDARPVIELTGVYHNLLRRWADA